MTLIALMVTLRARNCIVPFRTTATASITRSLQGSKLIFASPSSTTVLATMLILLRSIRLKKLLLSVSETATEVLATESQVMSPDPTKKVVGYSYSSTNARVYPLPLREKQLGL